jgi:hypothetical protein
MLYSIRLEVESDFGAYDIYLIAATWRGMTARVLGV